MFEQYAHLWPELSEGVDASPAQSPSLRLAPRRPYCWVADASGRAVFLPPRNAPRPDAELRVQPWPEAAQAAGVQRLLGAEAGVDAIPSSWTRCHDYCRARRGTPVCACFSAAAAGPTPPAPSSGTPPPPRREYTYCSPATPYSSISSDASSRSRSHAALP